MCKNVSYQDLQCLLRLFSKLPDNILKSERMDLLCWTNSQERNEEKYSHHLKYHYLDHSEVLELESRMATCDREIAKCIYNILKRMKLKSNSAFMPYYRKYYLSVVKDK